MCIQLSAQCTVTNESSPRLRIRSLDLLPSGQKPALSAFATGKVETTVNELPPACTASSSSPNREWRAELRVGKELAAELERQETIIHDSELTRYLNRLEQDIVRKSDLQGCFVVQLIQDVEANAYSLPGGFLYVTSGLILLAQSEGQLTAALAHETAHVTAHHLTRIEHQRRVWGRVALAGGPAGYLIRRFLGPLLTRKLVRNSEFEADRLSLKYQNASGYDLTEFNELLRSVFQDENKPASFVERLFDTHPLITTRITRLETIGAGMPRGPINQIVDTSDFQEVKKRLSGLMRFVPHPVDSKVVRKF
jgi:predicted Zn-dependent protease